MKNRKKETWNPKAQPLADEFLSRVRSHVRLLPRYTALLLADHEKALIALNRRGLSLEDAIRRLDPSQLGDFYRAERDDWYPLDHAAKIYPLGMNLKRMPVFRVSGYLREPVIPEILQMSLTYAIKRFPYFATTIKSGFFWHYLDSAMRRFAVRPETKLPCAVMRVNAVASPSLRVIYYKNRVSVEFFHILTDGLGGSIFLRTLLREYLQLLGHHIPAESGIFNTGSPPEPREWHDDFIIGDRSRRAKGFMDRRALQMRGALAYEQPCRILHYNLSMTALLQKAREKSCTVTALMMGYLVLACKEAVASCRGKRKIQIQMPVNMRKFYPSSTLRNFSMYCSIRLHPDEITTLAAVLPKITAQIKDGGSKNNLDQTIHLSRRLVRLLRFVPLIIKRPIAYLIYGSLGDPLFTTTLSNLGAIPLPAEMAPFVEKFDFVLGPPITNRAACALCSYEDHAVFTVTKSTHLPTFENALYRLLKEDGFAIHMEGSD
ncbi:MAG: hypothetical protein FWF86_02750 [Clostridia bacterium]|nr:hypothetical protein [Clostridia bacterium]